MPLDTIKIGGEDVAVDIVTLPDGTPGIKVGRDKVGFGADGLYEDVSAEHPLPVADTALAAALSSLLTELLQKLEPGQSIALDAPTLAALETIQASTGLDLSPLATAAKQDQAKTVLEQLHTDLTALLTAEGGLASQTTAAAILTALQGTLTVTSTGAADVAGTLTNGRKLVTAAGTAEAIRGALACKWVQVTALLTNTAQVNVGGSAVSAASGSSSGTPLQAGDSLTLPVSDAAKVFVDARVTGEGVSFLVGA